MICVEFLRAKPGFHWSTETVLVVHEAAVCVVEGAMSGWFGLPTTYCRYSSRRGLWEWSSTSTALSTDGGLDSRKGGTGVPVLGCAGERDVVPLGWR